MRRLWLLAALPLALLFFGAAPPRQEGQLPYLQRLNGTPMRLGLISSADGGAFTNWTTSLPDAGLTADGGLGAGAFDGGQGNMVMVQCPAAVRLRIGGTPDSYSLRLAADEKFYALLPLDNWTIGVQPQTMATMAPGCSVFDMQ